MKSKKHSIQTEEKIVLTFKPSISENKRLKLIEDILKTGYVKEVLTKIIIDIKRRKKK